MAATHASVWNQLMFTLSLLLSNLVSFVEVFGTVLSVLIAVVLYILKIRKDHRDAAMILLMEIRNAEKEIEEIKKASVIVETTSVMPINSWRKFQHYFVSKLDNDDLILLNNFYNTCSLIDEEVNRLKNLWPIANEEKIKISQQVFGDLAVEFFEKTDNFTEGSEYLIKREKILKILNNETNGFIPDLPTNRIKQYLPKISNVTTTTCGDKIKRIAARWF